MSAGVIVSITIITMTKSVATIIVMVKFTVIDQFATTIDWY